MTREEAKQILAGRYLVNVSGDDEYCEKINTAIDMAIDALSEPQTVMCKDCVYYDKVGWCENFQHGAVDDYYCKWAERREP